MKHNSTSHALAPWRVEPRWFVSDGAVLLWLGAVVFSIIRGLFWPGIVAEDVSDPVTLFWLSISFLPSALAIIVLLLRYGGQHRSVRWFWWLAMIPLGYAIVWLATEVRELLPISIPVAEPGSGTSQSGSSALIIIGMSLAARLIFAPLAEELVFREWLPRKFPAFQNIVVNSLAFGLLHLPIYASGPIMAMRVVEAGLIGAVLFLVRRQSGNIYLAIFLHALVNFFGLGIAVS